MRSHLLRSTSPPPPRACAHYYIMFKIYRVFKTHVYTCRRGRLERTYRVDRSTEITRRRIGSRQQVDCFCFLFASVVWPTRIYRDRSRRSAAFESGARVFSTKKCVFFYRRPRHRCFEIMAVGKIELNIA